MCLERVVARLSLLIATDLLLKIDVDVEHGGSDVTQTTRHPNNLEIGSTEFRVRPIYV